MKLRTIGVAAVAAIALAAGSAQAQEEAEAQAQAQAQAQKAGWDTKYGILFTLPNLFQNGSSAVISDYEGRVGAQYNLGPQAALRLSADLTRTSEGVTKTTDAAGVQTEAVPAVTSSYDVQLAGEYILRTSQAAVSPYLGAGAFINYTQSTQKGEDKLDGTVTTEYDSTGRTYGLGLVGKLGLEWRIHKVIALFAEYGASLTVVEGFSNKDKIADTKSSEMHFLNLDTGIAQGGQLGVIAFF